MKKLIALLMALMMIGCAAMASAETYYYATNPEYPPFESVEADGSVVGYDVAKTYNLSPGDQIISSHGLSHDGAAHADHPLIREQVEAMAIAVATEVNILDPSCVILGGGLLQMPGFPKDFFEEKIKAYTRKPYPAENLSLLYSRPDQDNGILGAGYYGWKCFKEASH